VKPAKSALNKISAYSAFLKLKALIATMIVERDIKIAPKAGKIKIPLKAKIPAAKE
jgi:hypothetical protein